MGRPQRRVEAGFMGPEFWGPVSDWVSGLATLAAVVVALWTALDTERKRLNEKYASVFAWFERAPGATFGTLYIKNSTEYPVYTWEVTATWNHPESNTEITEKVGSRELGLLPPSKEPHQFDIHEQPERSLPKNDSDVLVDMIFQDAQGRTHKNLAARKRT
jgi:hypothetical protein